MSIEEMAGLDCRQIAWALIREENDAREAATADGNDAYEDARRELLPRKRKTYLG